MFANGSDAKDFITTESEFKLAFNRIGLCASLSRSTVVSFSIEDSHPHVLLWGTYDECDRFRRYYEDLSTRCIARRRGSLGGMKIQCELYEVPDPDYLRNVAVYTIIQATKDGKSVMPYDYVYGTGAMYFRSRRTMLPWLLDESGNPIATMPFGEMSVREKRKICGSLSFVPDDWQVCNGFILPTNYVDVRRFESIYQTHNRFRVFLSSGKDKYKAVLDRMASERGLMIEDMEARKLCETACLDLFGRKGTRHITPSQRLDLARELRKRHGLSNRQLSILTKLPVDEIKDYLR